MQQALQAGKSFQFEVPSENASLTGGVAWWGALVQGFASLPGGMAEAFERDPRLAETYAALAAMPADAAKALSRARDCACWPRSIRTCCGSIRINLRSPPGAVVVPGGVEAEKDLGEAGRSESPRPAGVPASASRFGSRKGGGVLLRARARRCRASAVLYEEHGARADAFTTGIGIPTSCAKGSIDRHGSGAPSFFKKCRSTRMVMSGFPAGRPFGRTPPPLTTKRCSISTSLETLVAIAELEEKRGAPFDDASARLLARHFNEWHALFPYFEETARVGPRRV